MTGLDEDEPYSWNGPSNFLLSFSIAIASIGVPILVLITEQAPTSKEIILSPLELYGSKPSPTVSFKRASKLSR